MRGRLMRAPPRMTMEKDVEEEEEKEEEEELRRGGRGKERGIMGQAR